MTYPKNGFREMLTAAREEAEDYGLPPLTEAAEEAAIRHANTLATDYPDRKIVATAKLDGGSTVVMVWGTDRTDYIFTPSGELRKVFSTEKS
jgi:hypothetical protein